MSKSASIAVSIIFCGIVTVSFARADEDKYLNGRVIYADASAVPGAVVYALDKHHRLSINNNTIMVAENIPRAITDPNGNFHLKGIADSNVFLFARDMEDNCAFTVPEANVNRSTEIVMLESAMISGTLFKGVEPVKDQKINARYKSSNRVLRYTGSYKTNAKGQFKFQTLMPGDYLVQVVHEIPQIGCCFNSVVIKQAEITVKPDEKKFLKLGGTDFPFLKGKIADTEGNELHGVWVRLEQIKPADFQNTPNDNTNVAWSEVTKKDGTYQIFDIPPGQYKLHCFRRLSLNNYSRVLQTEKNITIKDGKAENICDVAIDLQPFMPLKYGQQTPELTGTLLSGENFNLAAHKNKIVVLYFYASWCSTCVTSMSKFDDLAKTFDSKKLLVLGVNLDKSIEECRQFISKKKVHHPQLFAGPWQNSQIRKDFHVSNVPTSFIIDAEGKIEQIDLFGRILKEFVKNLLQ